MSTPMVSLIIVNWNRFEDVKENIILLGKQDYPNFEIVIVDNGSTDGSEEKLQAIFPDISVISLGENRGPAAARNEAMAVAKGKYFIFIDSDAVFLESKAISKFVRRMEQDSSIGLMGCKVLNYYTREIDQWIYAQPENDFQNQEFETYSFSGAGAIVRASAIEQVGGFWEKLFIYNEEVELSIRLIKAGFRILYYPRVSSYHKESLVGRVKSSQYYTAQIRNWIWIFRRHYPPWHCWKKTLQYCCVYFVKGIRGGKLMACLKGMLTGLTGDLYVDPLEEKLTLEKIQLLNHLNDRRRIQHGR